MQKAIFFDMDGVLARYTPSDFVCDPPKHEVAGSHYFLTLEPDGYAVNLFHEVYSAIIRNGLRDTVGLGIISTISHEHDIAMEQRIDKKLWVWNNMLGSFGSLDAQIGDPPKSDLALSALNLSPGTPLTKNMILVDDFNHNLFAWREAGGRGVKYLNGLNSRDSWPGDTITRATARKAVVEKLIAYATEN